MRCWNGRQIQSNGTSLWWMQRCCTSKGILNSFNFTSARWNLFSGNCRCARSMAWIFWNINADFAVRWQFTFVLDQHTFVIRVTMTFSGWQTFQSTSYQNVRPERENNYWENTVHCTSRIRQLAKSLLLVVAFVATLKPFKYILMRVVGNNFFWSIFPIICSTFELWS